jgi:uncharacterized protein YjlB
MRLETWTAPRGGTIPNGRFPVLIYRDVDVSDAKALFAGHGWGGAWVNGVFDFHHFHSSSHEALAVVSGSARLELGGPQGESFDVSAGDVLVLPAGTGHRRASADGGFRVVGAYPRGQEDYDLLRAADEGALKRIAALGPPDSDPVGGEGVHVWSEAARG